MSKEKDYKTETRNFIRDLNEKKLASSVQVALSSVRLLKKLIGESKWSSASELQSILRTEYNKLTELMSPSETIVRNIWKRVFKIIKDESIHLELSNHAPLDSLQGNLFISTKSQTFIPDSELKPIMIEAISEIINEIETSVQNIAAQSLEHIHATEIILTMGKSNAVEAFLKGHELATNLSSVGLDVTLITDSAVFAIISRVNKVIIGTQSIFANGGLKAHIGTHALALAAKHHNIPLIVCSSMFKLSSEYYSTSDNMPELLPPDDILNCDFHPNLTVLNPSFDYVPPELITLFIFNSSSSPPSYVYRLLREMYDVEDEYSN